MAAKARSDCWRPAIWIPNSELPDTECCGNIVPQSRDKVGSSGLGFPAMRMVNGKYPLTEKSRLGFDLTKEALTKYPFGRTKPMARIFFQDGSVGEW